MSFLRSSFSRQKQVRHASNPQQGFLLIEFLIACGVVFFIFPLVFFYISWFMGQSKAAYAEIELREAANNMKIFLDASKNLPALADHEICISSDTEGKLSIYPIATTEENRLSDTDFIAKKEDASSIMSFPQNSCQTLYSPYGGTWTIFFKNSKKTP
jgi:hypothetical protein